VLFDSGSTLSYFNQRAVPDGTVPLILNKPNAAQTAAGILNVSRAVNLDSLTFPEFGRS
jgi:hypothetical protein